MTLSAILRGRIEEIGGWAAFEMNDAAEASVRLKRAIGVLPPDSAWWRSSTWRLASALEKSGKDAEALDMYIKSYKSGAPNVFRYSQIESLYVRINGKPDGLEEKIGPKPVSAEAVAMRTEPTPEAKIEPTPEVKTETTPEAVTKKPEEIPAAIPVATPQSTPEVPKTEPTPEVIVKESPKTEELSPNVPVATPQPTPEQATPTPTPEVIVKETPKAEEIPASIPVATPGPTPTPEEPKTETTIVNDPLKTEEIPASIPVATPQPTPEEVKVEATPEAPKPEPSPSPTPEDIKPILTDPTPQPSPETAKTPEAKPLETVAETKNPVSNLFPPVVITIPPPEVVKGSAKNPEVKPETSPTPAEANISEVVVPSPSPSPTETKMAEESKPTPSPVESKPVEEPKPSQSPTPEEPKTSEPSVPADGRPRIVDSTTEEPPPIKPCRLTVSEETVTVQTGGNATAVIIGLDNDGDVDAVTAVSTSPDDVGVRREVIGGVKTRALFVVRALSEKTGVYQVRFEMPCGKREIVVRVR